MFFYTIAKFDVFEKYDNAYLFLSCRELRIEYIIGITKGVKRVLTARPPTKVLAMG
jgi:hypothetical protein